MAEENIKRADIRKTKILEFLNKHMDESSKCVFDDKVFGLFIDEVCNMIEVLQYSSNDDELNEFLDDIKKNMD
jgi:hypothetical protein